MIHDPATRGPHHAAGGTPDRRRGSVRRTSSIDTSRPSGIGAEMIMDGRARDLVTGPDGESRVAGEARLWARVDGPTRALVEITTMPAVPALQGLVGVTVGPGWRARVDELVPAEGSSGSLLYLLLDDLPGAGLVSGYATQHDGGVRARPAREELDARVDLCAGWAAEATILVTLRGHGEVPMPQGPLAPELARDDDPLAWHEMEPLAPTAMRRCRRLDVVAAAGTARSATQAVPAAKTGPADLTDAATTADPAGVAGTAVLADAADPAALWSFDVFFRDSHMDRQGNETVVHEYVVGGVVDTDAGRIVDIGAVADVLPWVECPNAVASAGRLRDQPLAGLRPWVRQTFTGTTTCTHLNDTLRGLTDLDALVRLVAAGV